MPRFHLIAPALMVTAVLNAGWFCSAAIAQAGHKPTRAESLQKGQDILNQFPVHMTKEIPSNFPIPSYQSNVIQTNFSNSKKGRPTAAVSIVTKDQPQTVYQWYVDACTKSAWTVKTPTSQAMSTIAKGRPMYMLSAKKDNQEVRIFCTAYKKTTGTLISISWAKGK